MTRSQRRPSPAGGGTARTAFHSDDGRARFEVERGPVVVPDVPGDLTNGTFR